MLAPFLSLGFDVNFFVKKRLFSSLCPSGEYEKCSVEPKHSTFSLFVVTVTVTHPELHGTRLLFLLSPWITSCCHSWPTLNHLPLLCCFKGGFIGFLSHSCAEIDLVFKLTSAGKIKIDMTCLGLTCEECKSHFFCTVRFCTGGDWDLVCGKRFGCHLFPNSCSGCMNHFHSQDLCHCPWLSGSLHPVLSAPQARGAWWCSQRTDFLCLFYQVSSSYVISFCKAD